MMNRFVDLARKVSFCNNCGCYRLFIKDKDGWYCGTCGDYK